ncbi:hypothetical protein J1605_019124 [Eschrichtius robustus]|uniref:ubiquitinyl hydrolase 1 n=1 Tax=Eschrichtius robustus TaxID=9764 RepID=A0AB34HSG0_ESCRO|nr:hypothetical protein J1605_019124 [Eschrichtius robustus]
MGLFRKLICAYNDQKFQVNSILLFPSEADLDTDDDLNSDDYEYEDEAKLVIFPDHYEIALPNIEELPALVSDCGERGPLFIAVRGPLTIAGSPVAEHRLQTRRLSSCGSRAQLLRSMWDPPRPGREPVTIACDAVLSSKSPYRKQDPDTWENELPVSRYANNLTQLDNGVRIPPSGWKCARCDLRENLWLNLTDGSVLCGKWFFDSSGGNGHALEHYRDLGYPLAVKLGAITPDGADVYSFPEEEPVLDPHLAKHLAHFGIDMLHMHGTENGLQDNDSQPRISEWEVIQETGTKLKPMYGPGYTGLKNLGNSCYLSSVMQAIFSIPEFQRAYVGNLPRIFDYSPLDPTQDFNTQMTKLGHGLLSGQYSKPPMKSELIEQVMKEEHKNLTFQLLSNTQSLWQSQARDSSWLELSSSPPFIQDTLSPAGSSPFVVRDLAGTLGVWLYNHMVAQSSSQLFRICFQQVSKLFQAAALMGTGNHRKFQAQLVRSDTSSSRQ